MAAVPPRARDVVDLARSVSGYEIAVREEPGLEVWSSVRYPRQEEEQCVIRYDPGRARFLEYLVAHECGHVCRFYAARPEERVVPAIHPPAFRRATARVARQAHKVPRAIRQEYAAYLCLGLVRQVTNAPPDCRIEAWMHREFPALRDVQGAALLSLYGTFLDCMSPRVRAVTPTGVYRKSNAANYSLVKTIGHLVGDPSLVAPYHGEGVADLGERLAAHLQHPDRGFADDTQVPDAWAEQLGMRRWYRWRPFESLREA